MHTGSSSFEFIDVFVIMSKIAAFYSKEIWGTDYLFYYNYANILNENKQKQQKRQNSWRDN